MKRYYTGIGSRETPDPVLDLMTRFAGVFGKQGWVLRSGGAPGADTAFFKGAVDHEIYLPWKGFNNYEDDDATRLTPQAEAFDIAKEFHPAWFNLSHGGRKLMARNSHQLLGYDVTVPILSEFVICWTKDGKLKGGTAQALRMAEHYEVPVLNLGDPLTFDVISTLLKG